jgi:hypothetical protein
MAAVRNVISGSILERIDPLAFLSAPAGDIDRWRSRLEADIVRL